MCVCVCGQGDGGSSKAMGALLSEVVDRPASDVLVFLAAKQ